MKDELFQKPIVELPELHQKVKSIRSLPSERLLNLAIELRLKELRRMYLAKDDPRIPLRNRLAQLTRLRQ